MLDLECVKLKDAGENHEVLMATRGRATGFGLTETQGLVTLKKRRLTETNDTPIWERP